MEPLLLRYSKKTPISNKKMIIGERKKSFLFQMNWKNYFVIGKRYSLQAHLALDKT